MKFVDTHCHLDFEAFDGDRAAVVERARSGGIAQILVPGIDLETSRAAVHLGSQFPEIYAAVGIHPNSSMIFDDSTIDELAALSRNDKVVAIGEIGLDYYRMRAPEDLQRRVFIEQLRLAQLCSLPVIIHSRNPGDGSSRAFSDLLEILRDWRTELNKANSVLALRPGVLHSFSGTLDQGLAAIQLGYMIGITGPVTFQNAKALQSTVAELPVEHILIETDAPFLTPHPHRGKRNEPAYVRLVADKIAEIKKLPIDNIAEATLSNAERLFKWRVIHPVR